VQFDVLEALFKSCIYIHKTDIYLITTFTLKSRFNERLTSSTLPRQCIGNFENAVIVNYCPETDVTGLRSEIY
jgi:hypothetical protein